METKEKFKKFALSHPSLIDYVRNNDVSWQKLYELYDIYGENENAWEKYLSKKDSSINLKGLFNSLKNINLDSLEENISSIQKAVELASEFTKGDDEEKKVKPKREIIEDIYSE